MSAIGTKRISPSAVHMSAIGLTADIGAVNRFQKAKFCDDGHSALAPSALVFEA